MSKPKPINKEKILKDIIDSAVCAKAHFDILWAQISECVPEYTDIMNEHSDFFRASRDAHHKAFIMSIAQLYDDDENSSTLRTYLKISAPETPTNKHNELKEKYQKLKTQALPIMRARHKTIAHIDARLTQKEVWLPLKITWNEIKSIVCNTAQFVAELANATHLGAIGIPENKRMNKAVTKLLESLK